MELGKYIKEILIEKGSAAVPGFGIFEKITTPASINKATGVMQPPRPDIIFNSKDKVISDSFVKEIAKKEEQDEKKIAADVEKQIDTWLIDLNAGKTVTIDKLGTFKKEDNQIVLKSNIDVSEFPDFYGLTKINVPAKDKTAASKQPVKPIAKTTKTTVKEKPKKSPVKPKAKQVTPKKQAKVKTEEERKKDKRKLILALLLIPIIALIVLAIWKFDYVSKQASSAVEYFKGPDKKDALKGKEQPVLKDTIKPVKTKADTLAEERAKTEEALGNYTIIDSKTNNKVTPKMEEFDSAKKIHIIAGSFAKKINARRERKRLKRLGFDNAVVLPRNNNLYRVSVEAYEKVGDAVKNLETIKGKDRSTDFWILLDK